ncbi:MAG: hypothetical protein ACI3VB_00625 [Oscillospiraceae bacterium]
MKCTEFAKGLAIGMLAGGMVVGMLALPKRKHVSLTGCVLKTAGHVIEGLSEAFGV